MKRSKILILDDEHGGIQHLHDALHTEHDVVWTRDISHALAKLADPASSFDVIICGVHLLDESIFDFLTQIKAQADGKGIPFICFRSGDSVFAQSTDAQIEYTSHLLGATAYIAIPSISDPVSLRKAVEAALEPVLDQANGG